MVSRTRTSDLGLRDAIRRRPEGVSLAEQEAFRSIRRPVTWIHHPSFNSPDAEAELFGADDLPPSILPWVFYVEPADGAVRAAPVDSQLTAAQERRRFLQYNFAQCRLARVLSAEGADRSAQSIREALLWHQRATVLRAMLIRANMALVPSMIRRFIASGLEFSDLVSEGNLVLMHCVEKFDVSRGFRFSTYACRAILKRLGRLASRAAVYHQHFPVSYDPDLERGDTHAVWSDIHREESLADLRGILHENRAELDRTERMVVSERFALSAGQARKTLREVGERLGLTPERIRQIQQKALRKLRAALTGERVA
jgi:RNA polymerase sigma factor (sigma-70 family)